MFAGKYVWKIFVALAFLLVVGCSETAVDDDDPTRCPVGERYNTLSGLCQPVVGDTGSQVPSGNGQGTNNSQSSVNSNNHDTQTNNENSPHSPDGGNNQTGPDGGDTPSNNRNDQNTNPGGGPGTPVDGCGPGKIVGRVCAPSGLWLAAAEVIVEGFDCHGNEFRLTTQTDGDGYFRFEEVDANTMGLHSLTVRTGSFERESSVSVSHGVTTDLTSQATKLCLSSNSVEIAVIGGVYDDVEDLLDDLGLSYAIKGGDIEDEAEESMSFLGNLQQMLNYDIIFINCGGLWDSMDQASRETAVNNLRSYVNAGKSVYASDWSHPFVEFAFPDMATYVGNDAVYYEARMGYAPQTIQANVESQAFQTLLGSTVAQVEFPHSPMSDIINTSWVVAQSAGPNTVVHLRGQARLCSQPMPICGDEGGTQQNAPLLMTYREPTSGGRVIFTSFHNKAQASFGDDMEKMLRFLIFQL